MGEVLGARNPTTIRELLEDAASYKAFAGRPLILAALVAVDALAALFQQANEELDQGYHDLPDGVPVDALLRCGFRLADIERALGVPDPGVGAEHAPKEHP